VSKYAGGGGEALPWGLVMTVRVLIRALAAVSGEAELLWYLRGHDATQRLPARTSENPTQATYVEDFFHKLRSVEPGTTSVQEMHDSEFERMMLGLRSL
jgi:hypothetical protein